MDDYVVRSWDELNDVLYEHSWKAGIERFRSDFVYRGMPSARYTLETSLMRLGEGYDKLEQHMLRAFRRYGYRYATFEDSIWNWLSLAQHHGLPTRMLDFTYSPYVALHFATSNLSLMDEDAVVWCVNYVKCQQLLPDRLRERIADEGANVFTVEMLNSEGNTLQSLTKLQDNPFAVFFEPESFDDRIVNQFALFALMSHVTTRLDEWLEQHLGLSRRIIIPSSLKWEVRDKLDQANITERVLLPGLDGLSMWLTRYYRPRSGGAARDTERQ